MFAGFINGLANSSLGKRVNFSISRHLEWHKGQAWLLGTLLEHLWKHKQPHFRVKGKPSSSADEIERPFDGRHAFYLASRVYDCSPAASH